MRILILNNSRKKSFRQTKRIISAILPSINNRVNIGNLPKRIIIQLIKELKKAVNRGTSIQIFIEDSSAYQGFKLIEVGKSKNHLEFFLIPSDLDKDLKHHKLIP